MNLNLPDCLCGSHNFDPVFVYTEPPVGEARFRFSLGDYRREVHRCMVCGHFLSVHAMDDQSLYDGQYVDSTYGDKGIKATFDRIINLPPFKSDNEGRVKRIMEVADRVILPRLGSSLPTLLDVGSGLGVFPYRMKQVGWDCTALDPDQRAIRHAEDVLQVSGICGDFMTICLSKRFHLVSFNKVLEHVRNPVGMLSRSRHLVESDGMIYVELPDGEAAVVEGPGREEFFVEHHHIFSVASLAILANKAGLEVISIERLREPSSKFTLRGFLRVYGTAR